MDRLPEECYLCQTGVQQISAETDERYVFEGLIIEDGIFVKIKDGMFPYKNFPTASAVFASNVVKAIIIEFIKTFSKWYLLPSLILLLPRKQEIADSFVRISWKVLSPHILKFQYLSKFARALHYVVFTFLLELGINEESADKIATVFVQIIDYDNAYRLRMVDLFSETDVNKLINTPQREVSRLFRLSDQRNQRREAKKIGQFGTMLSFALLIPRVRRAFKNSFRDSNFKDLQYDDAEKYWVCMRKDYKFMGMEHTDRMEYAKSQNWTYPGRM